jgi:hypothetical protein
VRCTALTVTLALSAICLTAAATASVALGPVDPALTRLFAPLSTPPGLYAVHHVNRPIREVAASLRALDPNPAPGAWEATRPEAHDAFGQAGLYDRFRLAQLFGGRRVTVVRGSLADAGGIRAFTLISPCPDPTLSRVEPGTMVIVLRLGHPVSADYNR